MPHAFSAHLEAPHATTTPFAHATRRAISETGGELRSPRGDQPAAAAYEHPDKWVNRLILGDSLVVMNSLLHYEHLGGQVQMIYMDPPYGVQFGSRRVSRKRGWS